MKINKYTTVTQITLFMPASGLLLSLQRMSVASTKVIRALQGLPPFCETSLSGLACPRLSPLDTQEPMVP